MTDDILKPTPEPTKAELKAALELFNTHAKQRIAELERSRGCPDSPLIERSASLDCDTCGKRIVDIDSGEVVWELEGESKAFRLVHKGRCSGGEEQGSAELAWFADRECALHMLAEFTADFGADTQSAQRLTMVAWATPIVASEEQRQSAAEWHRYRMKMDPGGDQL